MPRLLDRNEILLERREDDGFGLVELIIAMFLLAIITIALIPTLYNGIIYSAQQSTTATSTRQLNALVEQARETANCAGITIAVSGHSYSDGAGHRFTTSGTSTVAPKSPTFSNADGTLSNPDGTEVVCGSRTIATMILNAKDSKGTVISTVTAKVFLP